MVVGFTGRRAGTRLPRSLAEREGRSFLSGISIILSLLAGMTLGGLFYGGLWFTVRRLPESRHPALLALASFWIRSLIVLAGLVLLMKQSWQYGLLALVGFTVGRFAIAKFLPEKGPAAKCT